MEATLKKKENYTWNFVQDPGKILEFCECRKVGTLVTLLNSLKLKVLDFIVPGVNNVLYESNRKFVEN